MTKTISRRALLFSAMAAVLTAAPRMAAAKGPITLMDPREVYEKAKKGEIILFDVRTPPEWAETGLPEGAHALELAPTFLARLNQLTGGDKTKPIAFMCATGARSAYVVRELAKRGWTNLIDVAGGIFGGPTGPGWKAAGLPFTPWKKGQ